MNSIPENNNRGLSQQQLQKLLNSLPTMRAPEDLESRLINEIRSAERRNPSEAGPHAFARYTLVTRSRRRRPPTDGVTTSRDWIRGGVMACIAALLLVSVISNMNDGGIPSIPASIAPTFHAPALPQAPGQAASATAAGSSELEATTAAEAQGTRVPQAAAPAPEATSGWQHFEQTLDRPAASSRQQGRHPHAASTATTASQPTVATSPSRPATDPATALSSPLDPAPVLSRSADSAGVQTMPRAGRSTATDTAPGGASMVTGNNDPATPNAQPQKNMRADSASVAAPRIKTGAPSSLRRQGPNLLN